ncbi:MAG: twin-arginine translocase subunit TatB [Rhodocyclaceae bacterium]|jgi:sec-independent protein translocase protein TatB|nr:twin-arginine translocase subunit TatB [Rhodocyclaceae bacterium]
MFDVSFSELMVISVVALIVIGPERLPRVARTVGHLLGRLQRYVNTIKSDINREMHVEDLKRFQERVKADFTSIEGGITSEVASLDKAVADIESEIKPAKEGAIAVSPAPTSRIDGPIAGAETSGDASRG